MLFSVSDDYISLSVHTSVIEGDSEGAFNVNKMAHCSHYLQHNYVTVTYFITSHIVVLVIGVNITAEC